MKPRRIATIIPFYQRNSGILRRAVLSILGQDLPVETSVHVFIINDSSPSPPDTDLANLPHRPEVSFSVHHQSNTGPGGARNRGLDLAEAAGFDFIAFLDSDDVWRPPHLADALEALDQGYDFYFCDNSRDGSHESHHSLTPLLQNCGENLRKKSTELLADGPVLGFPAGSLSEEMINAYMCQTSCVVARSEILHKKRFDVELKIAGEDALYWVIVALGGANIAISWKINVCCGYGVNIYFDTINWDNPNMLERVGYTVLYFEKLKKMPIAMELYGHQIKKKLQTKRLAYSFVFMRAILKGRRPGLKSFKKIRLFDQWLLLRIPFSFLRVVLDRRIERNF